MNLAALLSLRLFRQAEMQPNIVKLTGWCFWSRQNTRQFFSSWMLPVSINLLLPGDQQCCNFRLLCWESLAGWNILTFFVACLSHVFLQYLQTSSSFLSTSCTGSPSGPQPHGSWRYFVLQLFWHCRMCRFDKICRSFRHIKWIPSSHFGSL